MYNHQPCAITGAGFATPMGNDPDALWNTLKQGKPLFDAFAPQLNGPTYQVARVHDSTLDHRLPSRQLRKLDRFTILALAASHQALASCGLEISDSNRDRIGIYLGNSTGGWGFVEPILEAVYATQMRTASPYAVTAWFPSAPQGEISILYKIGGFSKTIAADRISAGLALEQAVRKIDTGSMDAMLVGGAESPFSGLLLNAYQASGHSSSSGQYRPFSRAADGSLLGEGAALFVVEGEAQARARGANIHCRVLGIGKGRSLAPAIWNCLRAANVPQEAIDYVVLDGSGRPDADQGEYQAIAETLGRNPNLRMSAPKSMYGDLLGAGMAVDLLIGALSLERQAVLPTAISGLIEVPPVGKHVLAAESCPLEYVLVNGRDEAGQSLVVLLGRA